MSRVNYEKLKEEVWDTGRCSGCGACCAVCPADAIIFPDGDNSKPVNTGYCKDATDFVNCGACYSVCPRTKEAEKKRELLGDYIEIISAKSVSDTPGKQSGGAVTAILANALKTGIIDAVVTVSQDNWTKEPKSVLITNEEAMFATAGSKYNWWTPALMALSEAVVGRKYKNVAVIGTPCAVTSLRLMKNSSNDLIKPFGKAIRLIFGLFCTEVFDYRKLMEGKIESEMKIDSWKIKRMNVSGKLEIFLTDGSKKNVPLSELEDTVRPGCSICTDLTGVESDISAGAIGSPDGFTTLIIRTQTGAGFVESAKNNGYIDMSGDIDIKAINRLADKKALRGRKTD
ncbi:coenzyme F420 hydrogenase subunit beta [Methanomicrobium sp. W14]|uniref:Coenzyme F420 hydrogenase/dehydrogenase, beta subunit C-terminal domain n=1 Tax=Methanomicrobium sp. W14 TaxID=2817839 RepID=UPI001AE4881C|nr:Coenzyme F420 hydrogenase/dehydrogenase, beta subunit C-terminal domain [Methanomicrobium sp. W14]MBP2132531.1 coenzyme F420 hydrogenase subunit beta [Methanomicrobium sp. W14]